MLLGQWRFTFPPRNWASSRNFKSDGTLTDEGFRGVGKWTLSNNIVHIEYPKGDQEEMQLPLNPNGMKVPAQSAGTAPQNLDELNPLGRYLLPRRADGPHRAIRVVDVNGCFAVIACKHDQSPGRVVGILMLLSIAVVVSDAVTFLVKYRALGCRNFGVERCGRNRSEKQKQIHGISFTLRRVCLQRQKIDVLLSNSRSIARGEQSSRFLTSHLTARLSAWCHLGCRRRRSACRPGFQK
jgi:hypothetical protein